jgi:hypothetical protein
MQVQAVADRLAGLSMSEQRRRKSRHFGEPWKTIWAALDQAEEGEGQAALMKALETNPERDKILAEILFATPGAALGDYPSLDKVGEELVPVQWLWHGWIPLGMITLMGAAPGVGKTFLCLDLARRVIHADGWPDKQPNPYPRANVLYVDAESVPQILNERAKSWGMNRKRLYLMNPDLDDIIDFSGQKYKDRLTQMIAQLEPRLVIVDSLSSISSKGENNIEDVRQIMSFLNMLAREYECAVVIIHHLRKHSSMQLQLFDLSLDDFRGSSHIVAMARSVLGVSVVQTQSQADRNGPRKVEIVKTNLGPYPEALGFTFAPGAEGGVVLKWDTTAPKQYEEPTQRDECKEWLEDFLKEDMEGKPVAPKEVVKAAADEGFSRALIFRARKELIAHIKNTEGRKNNKNCWQWSDTPIEGNEYESDDD